MNDPKALINEVVAIKNSSSPNEEGFGKIVSWFQQLYEVHMSNSHCVFVKPDNIILQQRRPEALAKLKERIEDWYGSLLGCPDKTCLVYTRHKNELDEALNLIELLKVL